MTNFELEDSIEKYGKDIYSFCRYLTKDTQEADDLYQDIFLKAIESGKKLNEHQNIKSYLLSISVRLWKNRKRKFAWRKRIADIKSIDEGDDIKNLEAGDSLPENQLLVNETMLEVRDSVSRLPEKYKIIVLLYYMEDRTVAQISEILEIPEGTVKSRLYKARNLLKEKLEVVLNG